MDRFYTASAIDDDRTGAEWDAEVASAHERVAQRCAGIAREDQANAILDESQLVIEITPGRSRVAVGPGNVTDPGLFG